MEKELTFGQQLVGLSFNPSGDEKVQKVKELCAELADLLHEIESTQSKTYLNSTFYGGAIRRILDAQMWSVKYISNNF
jgi:hypothetical protein